MWRKRACASEGTSHSKPRPPARRSIRPTAIESARRALRSALRTADHQAGATPWTAAGAARARAQSMQCWDAAPHLRGVRDYAICRTATAAAARFGTWSRRRTFVTCFCAVVVAIPSTLAISLSECPLAMSATTSRWRGVHSSVGSPQKLARTPAMRWRCVAARS